VSRLTYGHIQHMYSWWWVRLSPETCRAMPLRKIKTQLLHLVVLISLLQSLHVSGNYVPIIRRNNCVYATLGTCHSVWMIVWYARLRINCAPSWLYLQVYKTNSRSTVKYRKSLLHSASNSGCDDFESLP